MLNQAEQWLNWLLAHPWIALTMLFVVSLVDALLIIGALVPASIFLFATGALVALGALDLWPTAAIAALGAVIGDGVSFWFGRRYGERLFATRLLQRYPELIANGRRFFDKHGTKGVMLARFLGPVRAITPALAGASGMPTVGFIIADFIAAYLWALLYLIPGVVFGASLGLASEVAGRLAMLLLLSFVVIGVGAWASAALFSFLQRRATRIVGALLDWSRAHRRIGRFGAALADPDQPETPALFAIALILVVAGALWLYLYGGHGDPVYPTRIDALIYQTLHDLQTPWGNALALSIASLGEPFVYAPVGIVALLALLWRRDGRAAAHWVAACAFGALISLTLHALPMLPPPSMYYHGIQVGSFTHRDLVIVTVIYGFLPVLLSTHRPIRVGRWAYALTAVLLSQIVLARLYLGAEWWSLSLFSLLIALLWLAALGFGYRRHARRRAFGGRVILPVLATFLLAAILRWSSDGEPPERLMPANLQQTLSSDEWWKRRYAELPLRRVDMRGEPGAPFDLQWAGELPQIAQELEGIGWQRPPPLGGGNVLRWLTASTPIADLPLLPQVHGGSHQVLTLRLPRDDDRQWLLRLWPSGWRVRRGPEQVPVWVGTIVPQEARELYRMFRYPVSLRDSGGAELFVPPPGEESRMVSTPVGPLRLIREQSLSDTR